MSGIIEYFERVIGGLEKQFNSLPGWLHSFIVKIASSEGDILQALVAVAVEDVKTGGLTTAAFVTAGKDVYAKLVAQNISTFNLQYVIAAINLAVSEAGLVTPEVKTETVAK